MKNLYKSNEVITFNFYAFKNRLNQSLTVFFIALLHAIITEEVLKIYQTNTHMEYYEMENKTLQTLINNILDSGLYTLDGIANYTRIPYEVIYDALCGIQKQYSISFWKRIIALYLQVFPEKKKLLLEKLNDLFNKHNFEL